MLKTIKSSRSTPKAFRDEDKFVEDSSGRAGETAKNLSQSKKSKNNKSENLTRTNIGATKKPRFLTSGTKKAFN